LLQENTNMRLSVIISTYNQPVWLENVIRGFAAQSHADFELVIADDGSNDQTRIAFAPKPD